MVQSSLERYKKDIARLTQQGAGLVVVIFGMYNESKQLPAEVISKCDQTALPKPNLEYEIWYSESLALIKQLLPERVDDFQSYYRPKSTRKTLDSGNYTMSDFLRGLSITRGERVLTDGRAAVLPMLQQYTIVNGLEKRFESTLYDIKTLVHADLLDDELHAAEELNSKGFQRGAGAVAGVVLEAHLASVCERHRVPIRKNDPSISDLNDALKTASIIETQTWRFIQHLGDLRNKCDHKKATEPTKEEVIELIEGVRKITKTVF